MLGVWVVVDGRMDKVDVEFFGEEIVMVVVIVDLWVRISKRMFLKGIVVVDEFLVSCGGLLIEKVVVDV